MLTNDPSFSFFPAHVSEPGGENTDGSCPAEFLVSQLNFGLGQKEYDGRSCCKAVLSGRLVAVEQEVSSC